MSREKSCKFVIVPDHQGKTIEICINRKKTVLISLCLLSLTFFVLFMVYRYHFYRDQVYALINHHSLNNSSIHQISNDSVKTKLDLIRLKAEIDLMDKFIAASAKMDTELKANLKIPHSNVTFADIFQQNAKKRPSSFPATSNVSSSEITQRSIEESQERQKHLQELMDRTPSGYPVKGKWVDSKKIFHGPGLAIKTSVGSLIHTTANGKVLSIIPMDNPEFFVVELEHPADSSKLVITRYLYCTELLVYEGQELSKGQVIGFAGLIPHLNEPIVGYQLQINKMLIQP